MFVLLSHLRIGDCSLLRPYTYIASGRNMLKREQIPLCRGRTQCRDTGWKNCPDMTTSIGTHSSQTRRLFASFQVRILRGSVNGTVLPNGRRDEDPTRSGVCCSSCPTVSMLFRLHPCTVAPATASCSPQTASIAQSYSYSILRTCETLMSSEVVILVGALLQ